LKVSPQDQIQNQIKTACAAQAPSAAACL